MSCFSQCEVSCRIIQEMTRLMSAPEYTQHAGIQLGALRVLAGVASRNEKRFVRNTSIVALILLLFREVTCFLYVFVLFGLFFSRTPLPTVKCCSMFWLPWSLMRPMRPSNTKDSSFFAKLLRTIIRSISIFACHFEDSLLTSSLLCAMACRTRVCLPCTTSRP